MSYQTRQFIIAIASTLVFHHFFTVSFRLKLTCCTNHSHHRLFAPFGLIFIAIVTDMLMCGVMVQRCW